MVEILSTKLFIPRPRKNLVSRQRLIERLNAGQDKKLTLIAAPAGFGKTTLLSEWIPTSPHCVTWQSLDEGDSSPARFWMYFIAALQTLSPELGRSVQALLPSLQPYDFESYIIVLINEINAFGDSFVHVFDDYHLIESTEIDHELAYLIDHQPSNLHPGRPHRRLDCWPAISRTFDAGTPGCSGFIQAFAGDHRYIVDYLVEEVLQRQSECVRTSYSRPPFSND
jgi:ATP/maltotriose-dependent transcriptional regulator MalT